MIGTDLTMAYRTYSDVAASTDHTFVFVNMISPQLIRSPTYKIMYDLLGDRFSIPVPQISHMGGW